MERGNRQYEQEKKKKMGVFQRDARVKERKKQGTNNVWGQQKTITIDKW